MYTYLLLNIFTIVIPLALSFDKKVQFWKKWKFLFPAIFITLIFFIIWDHYFTKAEIWGFNPEYLVGIWILELPLEEWLFFITVPYACVFIYESLNAYLKKDIFQTFARFITLPLAILIIIIAVVFNNQVYTFYNFLFSGLFIILHWLLFRYKYLGKFFQAYLVHLIPFVIVNGVLTSLPVVWYNNSENFSIRIGTIPVEDFIYSLLLLLMNITIYEFLRNKIKKQKHK
jgi:lycopene cyclase domain-containing protein